MQRGFVMPSSPPGFGFLRVIRRRASNELGSVRELPAEGDLDPYLSYAIGVLLPTPSKFSAAACAPAAIIAEVPDDRFVRMLA